MTLKYIGFGLTIEIIFVFGDNNSTRASMNNKTDFSPKTRRKETVPLSQFYFLIACALLISGVEVKFRY